MADRERIIDEMTTLERRMGELERELDSLGGGGDDDEVTRVDDGQRAYRPEPQQTVAEGRSRGGQSLSQSAPPSALESDAGQNDFEEDLLTRRVRVSTLPPPPAGADGFAKRYAAGELLGQGGMGEVRIFVDRRIGRAVAMKIIRPEASRRSKNRARFLFEAKVQGQLEHPSIVPVYDLGVRPDGSEYFTMKRVHGRTLHDVLKGLRAGDKGTQMAFSRRRLLTAFQSVCQAVEFSHRRGVVHRDLKPANIMLGNLGEVSILDWGCAKISEIDRAVTPSEEARTALTEARQSEDTAVGEILGTPGYMSPEQTAGDPSVDARSDVFALGAILYETLTLTHLVPGKSSEAVNMNTLRGAYSAKISEKFPDLDVPNELEEACLKATHHDRAERMQSAIEMYEVIERYLEGDRDVKRRRALAGKHTRAAIAAIAEITEGRVTKGEAREVRARALREVTRALAIDPENSTALRTMMKLMTELPAEPDPAAEAAVVQMEDKRRPQIAVRGTIAYGVAALNLMLCAALGVRDILAVGAPAALFLAAAAVALFASQSPTFARHRLTSVALILLSSLATALTAVLFGPFVYVPSMCAANVVVFAAGLEPPMRRLAIASGVVAVLVPIAAQMLGFLPEVAVAAQAGVGSARAIATTVVLGLEALGAAMLPALLVGAERDARATAERKLALQIHQLADLVPAEMKTQ